jgi:hypothetical protein
MLAVHLAVPYSEEFVEVEPNWLDEHFWVETSDDRKRYFLTGSCPRCFARLRAPLGQQPRRPWYKRRRGQENVVKQTVVICGCGKRHDVNDQETRLGCGVRWRFEMTVLLSE